MRAEAEMLVELAKHLKEEKRRREWARNRHVSSGRSVGRFRVIDGGKSE
jgi:hypothetical protein